MRKVTGNDIQVTKEDQININNFSKLYSRQQELTELIINASQKVNQHKDTLLELEINDDFDMVRYRFGSCFFSLPTIQVKKLVEKQESDVKDQIIAYTVENQDINQKCKKLKATLYSKFGNSINLQE